MFSSSSQAALAALPLLVDDVPPWRCPQIRKEEDQTRERHKKAFDDMVAAAKANPPPPHDPMRFRAVPPGERVVWTVCKVRVKWPASGCWGRCCTCNKQQPVGSSVMQER